VRSAHGDRAVPAAALRARSHQRELPRHAAPRQLRDARPCGSARRAVCAARGRVHGDHRCAEAAPDGAAPPALRGAARDGARATDGIQRSLRRAAAHAGGGWPAHEGWPTRGKLDPSRGTGTIT
jgi:hypothetical protein